jgi:hypothetical protein
MTTSSLRFSGEKQPKIQISVGRHTESMVAQGEMHMIFSTSILYALEICEISNFPVFQNFEKNKVSTYLTQTLPTWPIICPVDIHRQTSGWVSQRFWSFAFLPELASKMCQIRPYFEGQKLRPKLTNFHEFLIP